MFKTSLRSIDVFKEKKKNDMLLLIYEKMVQKQIYTSEIPNFFRFFSYFDANNFNRNVNFNQNSSTVIWTKNKVLSSKGLMNG